MISNTTNDSEIYPLDKKITFIGTSVREEPEHNTKYARVYHRLGACDTIQDFWKVVNSLNGNYDASFLNMSLPYKKNEANTIFANLLTGKFNNNFKNMIMEFNYLHPTWILMNVDGSEPPYIRDNSGLVKNEINLYAKESAALNQQNLFLTTIDFTGFMDRLILDFVGGNFPDSIIALVFQKTIESFKLESKVLFYRGFRVRILLKTCDQSTAKNVKNFINMNYKEFKSMFKC